MILREFIKFLSDKIRFLLFSTNFQWHVMASSKKYRKLQQGRLDSFFYLGKEEGIYFTTHINLYS